jgi:tetratricopeptide (TPR) repeat protein
MRTALNEPKNYQAIMLSSTFTDLKEHRQRAIKAIEKFGYRASVMEYDGARADADVIESSLEMARDSVAYICVISLKYGQTPYEPDRNPDRRSITELEFNEATRLGRPIVLFVMDEEHLVRKADIESDPGKLEKLNAFRVRAKRMGDRSEVERVHEMFETLEQFSVAAAVAVGRLVQHLEQRGLVQRSPAPHVAVKAAAPRKALSNIPITVALHFLGRDQDIAAIDTALKGKRSRAAITTALHGLRGVGKTTLAAAYAEQHRDSYRATWWIRAETIPTMRADLVGLGVRLGWVDPDEKEEPALVAVLERLRDEGDGILLVYDNANNANEIAPYMPHAGVAHIIVTSNAPNWSGVAAAVEIEKWPKEIGADYLVAQTGRRSERDAALELSTALDGLPLAHEQAAAYCARTGLSLADYRRKFEAEPTKFLDAEKDASPGYHNRRTAAKTFALAIDEAARLHPAAEPLIVYAALLAPEPIPLFLFAEAREEFGEPLASALADDGLDEAVAALRAFALIERESIPDERDASIKTDSIRQHRLVRQVAAARRREQTLEDARRSLIKGLAAVYPGQVYDNPETWARVRRLDVFAMALVGGDAEIPTGVEEETANLLSKMDSYRHSALAAYSEALRLSERALAIREGAFGPDDPSVSESLNSLAWLLHDQGERARARVYLERALAIDERVFGPNSPTTAITLNNLVYLLLDEGDLEKAHGYFERAIAISQNTSDYRNTAALLNNFGSLLHARGDATARGYFERSLAIREKELGPDHPHTAKSLNNLGSLLWDEGDLINALLLLQHALVINEKVFGPTHPDTRNVAKGVARVLVELGRLKEAEVVRQKYEA